MTLINRWSSKPNCPPPRLLIVQPCGKWPPNNLPSQLEERVTRLRWRWRNIRGAIFHRHGRMRGHLQKTFMLGVSTGQSTPSPTWIRWTLTTFLIFNRQNINSELSTSALGNSPKANALPYGNFALRPHQVDAILHRAKGTNVSASSELLQSTNAFTYLKFGLPRVSAVNPTPGTSIPDTYVHRNKHYGSRGEEIQRRVDHAAAFQRNSRLRKSRSEADIRGRRISTASLAVDRRPDGGYSRQISREMVMNVRSPSEGDINKLQHYRVVHRTPGPQVPYTVAYRESYRNMNSPERQYIVQRAGGKPDSNKRKKKCVIS